jgi:hypothetical protein
MSTNCPDDLSEDPSSPKDGCRTGQKWLRKIARITAWVLFSGIAILIITGWGITHTGIIYQASLGLVDRRLADAIHRAIQVPLSFFLVAHVFLNVSLGSRSSSRLRNVLLVAVAVLIVIIIFSVENFAE